MVTRRAKRVSDFLGAECFAVVVQPSNPDNLIDPNWEAMEKHLKFARNLHIETRVLKGKHAPSVLVDFARQNQITQIFVNRPAARPSFLARDPIQRIIDLATDMQIVIVSDRERTARR